MKGTFSRNIFLKCSLQSVLLARLSLATVFLTSFSIVRLHRRRPLVLTLKTL